MIGGPGSDTMTGGNGKDIFVLNFSALSTNETDTIIDFNALDDSIQLSMALFDGFSATGVVTPMMFINGTAASSVNHRLIYDIAGGTLSYDEDGSGAIPAILIGTFQNFPVLTESHFNIIA